MGAGNKDKLQNALSQIVSDFLDRRLPLRRITLVASLLKDCSVESRSARRLVTRLLREQHEDGGWVDCEDTAWALFYIDEKKHERERAAGMNWLSRERNKGTGWGFCKRDHPSIPMTGQILYLLPDITSCSEAVKWLERQWQKDFESPIRLTYKAAWYLLSYVKHHEKFRLSKELFDRTLHYLVTEQRPDGSWGPWKNHPAASDCYSTGVSIAAIASSANESRNIEIRASLKKSIRWIRKNQVRNGLFPTHYIEEGSAWIYWGWSKAEEILNS